MDAQIHTDLRTAYAELEAFGAQVDADRLLARLRAERPYHPLFALMSGLRLAGGLLLLAAVSALAVPFVDPDLLRGLASHDVAPMLPLLFLMGGGAFLVAATALRQALVARGERSPLLADERKVHQRIVGRITQLKCAADVAQRTPAPAERLYAQGAETQGLL